MWLHPVGRRTGRAALAVGLAMAVLSAGGCHSAAPPAQVERWADAWIMALNSHQLAYFDPLFGPPGTYEDPVTKEPVSGARLGFYLSGQWRRFPKLRYEQGRVTGDRNTVVVEWLATGFTDDPQAKPVPGVFVLALQGEAITSVRAYFDSCAVLPTAR